MTLIDRTKQFIDIPSVTGDELSFALFLEAYLRELGWNVDLQDVAERRKNVFASLTPEPRVLFCTHLDTVPPFFPASIESGTIFGRGSCDAKGIIAAMIEASESIKSKGESSHGLLFVVGEETDSAGAKASVRSGLRSDFIIVGEPTNNKLALGQKGSLSYTLRANGIAGHSAYPESGRSAIHALLSVLEDIRHAHWGSDALLGDSTFNIGMLSGGQSANSIAAHAEAQVFHRLVDSLQKRKVQLEELLQGRVQIEFHAQNDPQQLHILEGYATTVVNFGSDVPYLRAIGVPLLIGPGSILDAHTEKEKISIKELTDAAQIYEDLYFQLTKQ